MKNLIILSVLFSLLIISTSALTYNDSENTQLDMNTTDTLSTDSSVYNMNIGKI